MRSPEFWQWFDSFAAPRLSEWRPMDRSNTFRKMFEHLDRLDRAVHIVETGCLEDPDNWKGNGCSTILFSKYIESKPGSSAISIEIDAEKVMAASKLCPNVIFYCGDSVTQLAKQAVWGRPVDLLYLDASHHSWINEVPSQVHHYNELMTIMPMLRENSLVVVDDSIMAVDDYPQNRISGKGGLVAQYALEVGAVLQFCEYQTGFTKITGRAPETTGDIDNLIDRARQCVEAGDMLAADRLYRLVLIATPPPRNGRSRVARGEACANFARNAHRLRQYGVAFDWFRKGLEDDPLASDYRIEMARSLVAIGALDFARREASIACDISPEDPQTWSTLAGVESDRLDEQACLEAYDKQIEAALATKDPYALSDAYLNRATIAIDTRDYDYGRTLARMIIDLEVRQGDAWHLLAMMDYRESKHEEAIACFDKALELGCRNQPLAHWNKSLPLQSIGRLKEGFAEHAWGEKEMTITALYIPHHRFQKPKWRGEKPPCTIHVHAEAGHGDNISMLRYFPILLEKGYKVHYESDPKLLSLAARNFPDVVTMPRTKDYPGVVGIKPFDYHLPVGDLPHALGTDIDTVPWFGPYLKADPVRASVYAERLAQAKGRKIGLCWSSGIRRNANIWMEKYGRMKSMHFDDLAPILEHDDTFISLQIGDGREEMPEEVLDLLSKDPDWDETAALIDNLDLVITVDTGVAHLAGAMGKETWVMMSRDGASWHFMCHRPGASWNEKSPWYPSVRLFRQHEFNTPGFWRDVVKDVNAAL